MTLSEMTTLLKAQVRCGHAMNDRELQTAFAGDLLSDVLALGQQPDVLLTGLVNPQVIRTAEMLDIPCIIFSRGKLPSEEMLEMAADTGVAVLATNMTSYQVSGELYARGLRATRTKDE